MPQITICQNCNHKVYVGGDHDCVTKPQERNYLLGFCKLAEATISSAFDVINTTHWIEYQYRLTDIIRWAERDQLIIPLWAIIFDKSESRTRDALIRKAKQAIRELK